MKFVQTWTEGIFLFVFLNSQKLNICFKTSSRVMVGTGQGRLPFAGSKFGTCLA